MSSPLVSVVIPAYNAVRTLRATVQSVLTQTVQDFEIIIVNDGSKDDTFKLAQELSANDARITALTKPNGGVSSTRNMGIRAARGKYVALLDADDLWIPHKLERQLEVLESGQNIFAVQSGAYFVNDNLEILSVRPCVPSKNALLEILLFENSPNAMSTFVIRRDKFDEMGYFDEELEILEDWELIIRIAQTCNMFSIEEPLSLYRVHFGNRSRDLGVHIKPGFLVLDRLFGEPDLPPEVRRNRARIYAHFYIMLCGGSLRAKQYAGVVKWGAKAALADPLSLSYIFATPLRRFQRSFYKQQESQKYGFDRSLFDYAVS